MLRRHGLCVGGMIAALMGTVWMVPCIRSVVLGRLRGEPVYQGLPASYWGNALQQYHEWADRPLGRAEPLSARLLSKLWGTDWDPRPSILREPDLSVVPVFLALLKDHRREVRYLASYMLMELCPDDEDTKRDLLTVLREGTDATVFYHASLALCRMNPETAQAAKQAAMTNQDPQIREEAIAIFGD